MKANITEINSDDHIVKIKPDEDVILATNPEGDELCRLEFECDGRQVRFKTPAFNKFPRFMVKLAELLTYLSQHAGNLEKPTDAVDLFKNPENNSVWKKLSAIAVSARPLVQKRMLDIFFNYLDGYIVGIEPRKRKYWFDQTYADAQIEWFKSHARIDDLQRIFSACLAVDDMLKKNAIFILERQILQSPICTEQSSVDTFAQKLGSTRNDLTVTPSYSFEPL